MKTPPLLAAILITIAAAWSGACGSDSETKVEAPVEDEPHQAGPQTCFTPEGHSGSPQTIDEVVSLLNALPKPVSVPCLLETLARPLAMEASSDDFSFQPAFGRANPRLLIFTGGLTITVVPKGHGSQVVEFGEHRGPGSTVKAELPFPVTGEIPRAAPFERVSSAGGLSTECGFCHTGEILDNTIDYATAHASDVLRPLPQYIVPIEDVRRQYEVCEPDVEPERCAFFDAIFGYGEVVHQPFPEPLE